MYKIEGNLSFFEELQKEGDSGRQKINQYFLQQQ
jgi:hypothetical protein